MSEQRDRVLKLVGEKDVPPADLLDELERFVSWFIAYPSDHTRVAHVLWVFHTHCMDEWDSTPRLAWLSPEPGSGKTRALEITETLVPGPVEAVNVTPSYLFRKMSDPDGAPTILYDEIDTVFGPKAKDNEEIHGMLNAGHRKGAMAGRCVMRGNTVAFEELPGSDNRSEPHDRPLTRLPYALAISDLRHIPRHRPVVSSGVQWRLMACLRECTHTHTR